MLQAAHIGNISMKNSVALAPMAGVADVPFRKLAWELGAGYMVSEMVSSREHLWETEKNRLRRVGLDGIYPNVIQIAGSDPSALSESAKKLAAEGADVVDINFGCPAKKVCKTFAGSALLDDLWLIGRIVEKVARAVSVPVTIKTRTGITIGDRAGVEAALIAQDAGAKMIVMHGRSRACRFQGEAVHEKAKELKAHLKIPLLVNGDICCHQSASKALKISAADGVMIGRGAIGQPWIFGELTGRAKLDRPEKWEIVIRHVELAYDFYGKEAGLRMMRKHIKAYLINLGLPGLVKAALSIEEPLQLSEYLIRQRASDIGLELRL